jgi:hypothetical protein
MFIIVVLFQFVTYLLTLARKTYFFAQKVLMSAKSVKNFLIVLIDKFYYTSLYGHLV